jgi:hypothetical protein
MSANEIDENAVAHVFGDKTVEPGDDHAEFAERTVWEATVEGGPRPPACPSRALPSPDTGSTTGKRPPSHWRQYSLILLQS